MIRRLLQLFFLCTALSVALSGDLQRGQVYPLLFTDVDRNQLSTSDGHVTIITVMTRPNEAKARAAAERVPDRYLGDPKYRYVTVVNFQKKLMRPVHGITMAVIRRRLNAEAARMRPKYQAKRLTRDPRRDIFVVADFDGKAVSQLGINPASDAFTVFVFNGQGRLMARWNDLPPAPALAAAIKRAR